MTSAQTKIIALIPARAGSKAVKNKNIQPLMGKPLLAYSIETALKVKSIDRVFVSTDSTVYATLAISCGAEAPFLRPAEISDDGSTDYEFVTHFLDWYGEVEGELPELIVHLRPTTPLRNPSAVESAIQCIKAHPLATALRSVEEMTQSSYKTFEISHYLKAVCSDSFALDSVNIPRQQFQKTYNANGYVDIVRPAYVMEHQLLHGNRVLPFITPKAPELDTPEDFDYLEWRMRHEN